MFINFSDNQIKNIRNEIFPAPNASTNSSFYISQITINSLGDSYEEGSAITCDFFVTIRDELAKSKIFREEKAKKFMKLRVFQILSSEMNSKLSEIKNIFQLEKLLNDYGAKYVDMSAGVGFLGSTTDAKEHYIEYTTENDTTGIVHLIYKNNFYFNKNNFLNTETLDKISYFGLGAVLFYDIREYIKDNEILEQFSFKETFISNIASYDLIVNGDNVRPQILRDLRVVDIAFTQNSKLNRLINEQNKLGIKIKRPTDIKLNTKQSYFSSLYLSKIFGLVNGQNKIYASGFFDIDFNSIIYENSPYKEYFKNLSYETFLNLQRQSEIKSIKIVRRRIDKYKHTNSSKTINNFSDSVTIINSGEHNNQYRISDADTINGFIEEIRKNNGGYTNESHYRTIHFLDKNIAYETSGTYQYGLEIEYIDGIKQFVINEIIPRLLSSIKHLNLYLNETNNIVKTGKYLESLTRNSLYTPLKDGFYDPLIDRFTYGFVNDPNSPYLNGTTNYKITNSAVIINYIASANYFGLLTEETYDDSGNKILINYQNDIIQCLENLLDPDFANIKSINYCIKIFKNLVNRLQNIISSVGSAKTTIDYWFTNEYYQIDTAIYNNLPSRGYKFLPDLLDSKLQSDDLLAIFERNIDSYISNSEKDKYLIDSNLTICLGPTGIYNKNNSINISFNDQTNIVTLPSPIFSNLEESIKKEKIFGYTTNDYNKDNGDNIEKSRQKFADFLSNYSITISKSLYTTDEKLEIDNYNRFYIEDKNSIQPYIINNILLKSINSNNGKLFVPSKIQKNCVLKSKFGISATDLEIYKQNACFQINSILENKNILLTDVRNNSENILPEFFVRDILQNSKYNLLFGTVHKIQYLTYGLNTNNNNKIKEEVWTDLSKGTLSNIDLPILCRIIPADLDGIYKDISMPIFNKHFLLLTGDLNSDVARDVSSLTVENLQYEENILDITLNGEFITEQIANLIPQVFIGADITTTRVKSTPPKTIPQRFDIGSVADLGNRFGINLDVGTRFGFLDTSKLDILKDPGGSFTTPRLGRDGGIELGTPKIPNIGLGAGVESQPSSTPQNPPVPVGGLERGGIGGGRVGGEIKGGAKKFGPIGQKDTPKFGSGMFGGANGPFGGNGGGGFGGNGPPGGFGGF